MDKDEHIAYWIKSADEDWITVHSLFAAKRYLHSLFFCHLTLEKTLKALWVKNNENNIPPKIHNLAKLNEEAKIYLSEDIVKQLYELNAFQLEGRYPDYLFEISKRCNDEFTNEIIQKTGGIRVCLLNKLC